MLDGVFFVLLSLAQEESFSQEEHLRVLCQGAVLVSEQSYPSALSPCIVMGFQCLPFSQVISSLLRCVKNAGSFL